LLKQIMGFDAH